MRRSLSLYTHEFGSFSDFSSILQVMSLKTNIDIDMNLTVFETSEQAPICKNVSKTIRSIFYASMRTYTISMLGLPLPVAWPV